MYESKKKKKKFKYFYLPRFKHVQRVSRDEKSKVEINTEVQQIFKEKFKNVLFDNTY